MKQILQDLREGNTILAEVPCPGPRPGNLLIDSMASLVSIGTERMMISFGKAGWLEKVRRQPDKVRQVIEKIKTDGLVTTYQAVNSKLDQKVCLGYSNVGRVRSVGDRVDGFQEGDLVVSNGPHAEVVSIEENLCAKVPSGVEPHHAAFTVVGSIGLQGIRLLQPTLGECFVVTGLGLIGLLAVQMLRANGCEVIGIDFDSKKCALAGKFGAQTCDLSKGEDPLSLAHEVSGGKGVDGVLITASTSSNEPVHQGAQMCRKRGRIVLVGVTGLELSRADFYEKELSFQVSCSYGPGRYDPDYEQNGNDYPIGFVRWTEQRNFEAFLGLLARGSIDIEALVSHRYPFSRALEAYQHVDGTDALGIVLEYSQEGREKARNRQVKLEERTSGSGQSGVVGVIGAGGFTGQVLLPALAATDAKLKTIVSSKGVSGTENGQKFGFAVSSTDSSAPFEDSEIDTIVITTRHNSHASMVCQGLEAGKNVYVEKPLCIYPEELERVVDVYQKSSSPFLMVGFNRRFAPHIMKAKSLLDGTAAPLAMTMMVNAGSIPAEHWTQDPKIGGGRLVGEGCHFIDLLRFLAGSRIVNVARFVCGSADIVGPKDSVTVVLEFEGGSTGTIQYLSNGNKAVSKERLEIFCGGRVLQIDNFRRMVAYGFSGFRKLNLWRQDKGHAREMVELVAAVKGGTGSPIPFDEIVEVTKASFVAAGLTDLMS